MFSDVEVEFKFMPVCRVLILSNVFFPSYSFPYCCLCFSLCYKEQGSSPVGPEHISWVISEGRVRHGPFSHWSLQRRGCDCWITGVSLVNKDKQKQILRSDSISGKVLDFEGNGAAEESARDDPEHHRLERRTQRREKQANWRIKRNVGRNKAHPSKSTCDGLALRCAHSPGFFCKTFWTLPNVAELLRETLGALLSGSDKQWSLPTSSAGGPGGGSSSLRAQDQTCPGAQTFLHTWPPCTLLSHIRSRFHAVFNRLLSSPAAD